MFAHIDISDSTLVLIFFFRPKKNAISKPMQLLNVSFCFFFKFQNTSRTGVYVLGDVCGKALLTPGRHVQPV